MPIYVPLDPASGELEVAYDASRDHEVLEEVGGETDMDMDAKSEIPERWIGCPRSASACAGSWRTE